ncbi:MAG: hypothetical protein II869_08900, partial [Synergistaceae bacterium]|nr:hypothetical protein [Synergistaceae bacterium]
INIRASDYRFQDKRKYYLGQVPKKPSTKIHELQRLATTKDDFTEQDIALRNDEIINAFISFIEENNLLRVTYYAQNHNT